MHNDTCLIMILGQSCFSLCLFSALKMDRRLYYYPMLFFDTLFGHFSGRHDDGDHKGFWRGKAMVG